MIIVLLMLAIAVCSYLLGSINGAIIVSKIYKKGDIRNYGSGNAGSTNVLRSVGKSAALITFSWDILKGIIAVLIAMFVLGAFLENTENKIEIVNIGKNIAGLFAIMGHSFPVFYGFKGGKGVATAGAIIAIIDWRVLIFVLLAFIISFVIKKTVSISSVLAAITFPIATFFITYFIDYKGSLSVSFEYLLIVTAFSLVIGLFVIIKHKDNIKRMLKGEEKPIFSKK